MVCQFTFKTQKTSSSFFRTIVAQVGFIERENASILNASIGAFAKRTIRGFENAMKRLGLLCPLYLTQVCIKFPSSKCSDFPPTPERWDTHKCDGCCKAAHPNIFFWCHQLYARFVNQFINDTSSYSTAVKEPRSWQESISKRRKKWPRA
jgi:hypothetical protein